MNVPARITKADLESKGMDALDPNRVGSVPVSSDAGGILFSNALEVMEFAKLLSTSQQMIPASFRNNPGLCLGATLQAVEWRMSPLAVINKMYVVNDRIGHEAQLVHAVIEARAPLRERLDYEYEGEGPDRVCKVIFRFRDGTERIYTSPKFKDIHPKNSPLWKSDPDQQQGYYSARAGSRRFCPDVIMGVYTKEEMEANPRLGREDDPVQPGLKDRLAQNGDKDRTEGHREGHVESELSQIAAETAGPIIEAKAEEQPTTPAKKTTPAKATTAAKPVKPARAAKAPAAPEVAFDADMPISKVQSPAQYLKWWEGRVAAERAKGDDASPTDLMELYNGQDALREKLAVPVSMRLKITDTLIPSAGG